MASHKHGQNGMVARTRSSEQDVLRMAETVASTQQTDWFRGLGQLTVAGRSKQAIEFAVMGGLGGKYRQIAFTVTTGADSGTTTVRSKITFFRTSQSTVLYFIPVGPKLMNNYATYKLFLERLAATMREADSGSVIRISDTADTDPLPPALSPARD